MNMWDVRTTKETYCEDVFTWYRLYRLSHLFGTVRQLAERIVGCDQDGLTVKEAALTCRV